MADRPEYIKCARVVEAEDPDAEYEYMYEVKWIGRADDPTENTWEREALFSGPAAEIIEKFWESGPEPLSQPDDEGQFALGSKFEATQAYIARRIRLCAAAQLDNRPSRLGRPASTSITHTNKRTRSPTTSENNPNPANRRRQESPPVPDGEEYRALTPPPALPPRPMVRPIIGSVLTFKKGKALVQDRNREVQDARLFRVRGGLFLQQHFRKERERRLAEAKKRAEEAQKAAEEEARRIAEELAEAEAAERMADEARIAEENARLEAEAEERAARAAEWSTPQQQPPKRPSPPPLKDLLAATFEDDELPDFEDEIDESAAAKPKTPPPATSSMFGAPTSLLGSQVTISKKKKVDPYYWAKKMDEERKQKELLSRHPVLKLEVNGTQIEVFMKDIFNEPSRASNVPAVSIFAGSIIDTISTQEEVDAAITRIEKGWSPARSAARLAPIDNANWSALEVLALQLLVDGKVAVSSENEDGWRPILFASEEEGICGLLGASKQLANYKSTLLISMVRCPT